MPAPPWVRDVVALDAALFFDRVLPLVRERAPNAPDVAFVVGARTSHPASEPAATIVVDEATLAGVLAGRAPHPASQRPVKPRRGGPEGPEVRGDRAAVAALAAALAAPAAAAPTAARDLGGTPAEVRPMRLPNGRLVKGRRPPSAAPKAPVAPVAAAASVAADPVELALVNLAAWLARLP